MATPTMPTGCLQYSDFSFDLRSGDKKKFYLYAIVDCSYCSPKWDNGGQYRPRRLSFSRAVAVTGTRNYRDTIMFYGGEQEPYKLCEDDYTSAAGYQDWQESSEAYRPQRGQPMSSDREYGVIEIILWDDDDTEVDDLCHIGAIAVDTINDFAFDVPGASTREHVERTYPRFRTDYFVSAYHVQWCLATSINRCHYEDRQSYCWPVFADREQPSPG